MPIANASKDILDWKRGKFAKKINETSFIGVVFPDLGNDKAIIIAPEKPQNNFSIKIVKLEFKNVKSFNKVEIQLGDEGFPYKFENYFVNKVSLSGCEFNSTLEIKPRKKVGIERNEYPEIVCKNTSFDKLILNDGRFIGKLVFDDGCEFRQFPEFYDVILHSHTVFPPVKKFNEVRGIDAGKAYTYLWNQGKAIGDRSLISTFYVLWNRCKRGKSSWLSWLYDWVSKYGTSVGQSFWVMAGFLLLFLVLNRCFLTDWNQAFDYTTLQVIKPFQGFLVNQTGHLSQVLPLHRLRWKLGFLETLIFWILFPLFLLSIRWRYRKE